MNTILIVSVWVAGLIQGPDQQLLSISTNCHIEQLMLKGINTAYADQQLNQLYTSKCVSE
jgi:hypothetical protein